jgi:hypothetical protein
MQRHASLLIDMNHQRNEAAKSLFTAWAIHEEENNLSSFSHVFTSGEAYDGLVELGGIIIGHIMNDYAKEQDGWHHELLHHIVHGHKGTSGIFFKDRLYVHWKDWFEHKPHSQAPKDGPWRWGVSSSARGI